MTAVNDDVDLTAKVAAEPGRVPLWQRGYARRLVVLDFAAVVLAVG